MQPQVRRRFYSKCRVNEPISGRFRPITVCVVEEPSDSDPYLRRITVLALLIGSTALWSAIGLALTGFFF